MDTRKNAVIIFSKECLRSRHWMSIISDHLRSCFLTDCSLYRVTGQDIERLVSPDCPSGIKENVVSALVQIVIVSQTFLSHLLANPCCPLKEFVEDRNVIVLLVDINEEKDIKDPLLQVMPGYFIWTRVRTNDDDTGFTKVAVSEHVQKLLERMHRELESRAKFELHPDTIYRDRTEVTALFQEPQNQVPNDVQVTIRYKDVKVKAEKIRWTNPYAISFKVPAECFNFTSPLLVTVKLNQQSLGTEQLFYVTDHDRIELLLSEEPENVIENLCRILGLDLETYDELDNFLAEGLRPSIPREVFSWFSPEELKLAGPNKSQYPTLLHLACQFGLERFVCVLMDCPGAVDAARTKNSNDMDCIEIAKYYGHNSLGHFLQVYAMFFDMQTELQEKTGKQDVMVPCMQDDDQKTSCTCIHQGIAEHKPELKKSIEGDESTRKRKKSSYLGELRDLIEGFKEGQFTLEQAEMLVQWWKDRPDVQKENLTREEQMKAMRKEYKERTRRTGNTATIPTSLSSKLKILIGIKSSKPTVKSTKPLGSFVKATADTKSTFYLPMMEPTVEVPSPCTSRHSADSLISEAAALDDEGLPESCTASNASLIDEEESPYMTMQAPRSADSSLHKSIWFGVSDESLAPRRDEGDYVTMEEISPHYQRSQSLKGFSHDQLRFPDPPN